MEGINIEGQAQPSVPVAFVPVKGGDVFALGTLVRMSGSLL